MAVSINVNVKRKVTVLLCIMHLGIVLGGRIPHSTRSGADWDFLWLVLCFLSGNLQMV